MSRSDNERLEIYKQSVEMADRVSSRRGIANAFFVSLNAALVTTLSLTTGSIAASAPLAFVAICGVGALISVVWWLQLRSYRDLNTAKFAVILQLEKQLVEQPYAAENKFLETDKVAGWRGRYAELGWSERIVPWLFFALYVIIGVSSVVTFLCT